MVLAANYWDRPAGWTLDDAYATLQIYNGTVTVPADGSTQSQILTDQGFAWDVPTIIEEIGSQYGIPTSCENMDDTCFGCTIDQDKTFVQFLQQHRGPYNYQIVDGDPIRLVRRPINADLTIDGTIRQADCIPISGNGAALRYIRLDPASLPREVEIAYTDPERALAVSTQVARYPGAPLNVSRLSANIDFCISPDAARDMAYDWLYRIWASPLSIMFQVPASGLIYEPADVVMLETNNGEYTLLIEDSVITPMRTNVLRGSVLLTKGGFTVTGGTSSSITSSDILSSSGGDDTNTIVTI